MRRSIIALLAAVFAAFSFTAFAERPDLPSQNGVPVLCNFGVKSIATPTIVLTPGVKYDIGAHVPAGTIDFTFDVWDADILIGHEDNLATAVVKWTGTKIASGTQNVKWGSAGGGTVRLWAIPNGSASATVILGNACGQWEE